MYKCFSFPTLSSTLVVVYLFVLAILVYEGTSPCGVDLYFPNAHLGFDPKSLNFPVTALSIIPQERDEGDDLGEEKHLLPPFSPTVSKGDRLVQGPCVKTIPNITRGRDSLFKKMQKAQMKINLRR